MNEGRLSSELRFDAAWYLERYPDAALAIERGDVTSAHEHFELFGAALDRSANPVCSTQFIRLQLVSSGLNAPGDPRLAFMEHAAGRSFSQHWLFDTEFYVSRTPGLGDALAKGNLTSAFTHYARGGKARPHPLFGPWGAKGVMRQGEPSLVSFCRRADRLTTPSPLFDPEFYSTQYPYTDLEVGFDKRMGSYLEHFVLTGSGQGLLPIPDFDPDYYRGCNPSVDTYCNQRNRTPIDHFLRYGVAEGLACNDYFDPHYYLDTYPEVRAEIEKEGWLGPFEHFLGLGKARGYRPREPLYMSRVSNISGKAVFEKRAKLSAQMILTATKPLDLRVHKDEVDLTCILPVHNQFAMTIHLLSQLAQASWMARGPSIEVVLVDNGSDDETVEIETWVRGLRVERREQALGFTQSCNIGFQKARGRAVLFLNNDLELFPSAIEAAYERVLEEGVGAVGGRIVHPNGDLQEAGSVILPDGSTQGTGRGDFPWQGRYSYAQDVPFCSGCFLMVDAEGFRRVGGFDERFSPGYYEEVDLSLQLAKIGLKTIYEPAASVTHYEYASFSSGRPPAIATAAIERNKRSFRHKHTMALRDLMPRSQGFPSAPVVMMIEDRLPRDDLGSGFTRSWTVATTLRDLGCRVCFASKKPITPDEREHCEMRGFDCATLGNEVSGVEKLALEFGADIIWICRTHNFAHAAELQQWRSGAAHRRIVGDTEAVVSLRWQSLRELDVHPVWADERYDPSKELCHHDLFDRLVVVNERDAHAVREAVGCEAVILNHKLSIHSGPGFSEREGVLFLGSVLAVDSPNQDSIAWLVRRVWPQVLKRLPNARLRVVGQKTDAEFFPEDMRRSDGVEFVGYTDDPAGEFDRARVFVAPTRFAGGAAHKVQNAMAYGLPAVTTTVISNQLTDTDNPHASVLAVEPSDPDSFAAEIVRLHQDEATWQEFQQKGYHLTQRLCDPKLFRESTAKVLADLGYGKDHD